MNTANAGQQPIMIAKRHVSCELMQKEGYQWQVHIPIEHSSTVHKSIHFGSGVVVLPRPSVPNWTTRSVADAMQRKPLPKRTKMPAFWAFGICRFHVKRIGKNMTVSCQ
jgi:hypothetical protein